MPGAGELLVHFSESKSRSAGRGNVDRRHVDARRDIQYDGWVVAEAFAHEVPGLSCAADVWRSTFGTKQEFARTALMFMRESMR